MVKQDGSLDLGSKPLCRTIKCQGGIQFVSKFKEICLNTNLITNQSGKSASEIIYDLSNDFFKSLSFLSNRVLDLS
jgi:hypothetical protein